MLSFVVDVVVRFFSFNTDRNFVSLKSFVASSLIAAVGDVSPFETGTATDLLIVFSGIL